MNATLKVFAGFLFSLVALVAAFPIVQRDGGEEGFEALHQPNQNLHPADEAHTGKQSKRAA